MMKRNNSNKKNSNFQVLAQGKKLVFNFAIKMLFFRVSCQMKLENFSHIFK